MSLAYTRFGADTRYCQFKVFAATSSRRWASVVVRHCLTVLARIPPTRLGRGTPFSATGLAGGAVGQLDPRARRTASVLNAWAYRRCLIVDIAASSCTIVPLNRDVRDTGGIPAARAG